MSEYAQTTRAGRFTTRSDAPRSRPGQVPAAAAWSAVNLQPLRAALAQAPAVQSVAQLKSRLNTTARVTGLVQRSEQLAAGRGTDVVQRAVIAIDGASDDGTAKAITRSCLANLTTRKRIQIPGGGRTLKEFPAGDARGATYGPGPAYAAFNGLADGAASGDITATDSIYVLGHGDGVTVGGMDATALASELERSLSDLPGVYKGPIKLVACYSGSLLMDGKEIRDPGTNAPIDKSYAASLAETLTARKTATFQPSGAEGIAGIAWVDEITGQKTGLDVLGEGAKTMNPAERLYTDSSKAQTWFDAMLEKNPEKRRDRMEAILESQHEPNEKSVPTRRIGKAAKRWFPTR